MNKKLLLTLAIGVILIVIISPISADENITDVSVEKELISNQISNNESSKIIIINNDNYKDYFEPYSGEILEEANISAGDTLKIGSVENKLFIIDRPLTITSLNVGDIIHNGYIKLIDGSSGSIIHGITIENDKDTFVLDGISTSKLHGIGLFYTDNNTLYDNYVKLSDSRGVFALPMGDSCNNKIYNNTFISTLSTCVPMADCHNNIFYNNYMQSTAANVVYYNHWGHAGYIGSQICMNNTFYGNRISALVRNSQWVIGMALDSSVKVTLINNTIYSVYNGVSETGTNSIVYNNKFIDNTNYALYISNNVTCVNNTFNNCNVGIFVAGSNSTITNNTISNLEGVIGIWVYGENATISHNTIELQDVYYGINVEKPNVKISDNKITVKHFGEGVRISADNVEISNNEIMVNVDSAIYMLSSNNLVLNNKLSTNLYGVYVDTESEVYYHDEKITVPIILGKIIEHSKLFNNTISDNVIDAKAYGIYLLGSIYSTTIVNNFITTNGSIGVLSDVTDPFSNNIQNNIVNGVYINYTGLILNDDNFKVYFDENGTFKNNNLQLDNIKFVITFLTNKNIIISQPMTFASNGVTNLLNNVSIFFIRGSDGSRVENLVFHNSKSVFLVNNANNISINNVYINLKAIQDTAAISIINSSFNKLENIAVYVNDNNHNVTGFLFNNSKNLIFINNSLILESKKFGQGFNIDNMVNSTIKNNTLQLLGFGNIISIKNSNNLDLSGNNFIGSVAQNMSILTIENSSNINFNNTNFEILTNVVDMIKLVNTTNVDFYNSFIKVTSNIKNSYLFNLDDNSNCTIINSIIYHNQIDLANKNIAAFNNTYVIFDDNINSFFDLNGNFISNKITKNDILLFDNINLNHHNLIFNSPVNIKSFSDTSKLDVTFIFNTGSIYSNISGLTFDLINSNAFILNSVSNINISNNNILISNNDSNNVSAIKITGNSTNNLISNNNIIMKGDNTLVGIVIFNYYDGYYGLSPKSNEIIGNKFNINSNNLSIAIYNSMTSKTRIINNEIMVEGANRSYGVFNDYLPRYKIFMSTIITENTLIKDNLIECKGDFVCLIYSRGSKSTTVNSNVLRTNSNNSFAYFANQTSHDYICYNDMTVNGAGNSDSVLTNPKQTGIYLSDGSKEITLRENSIVSNYIPGNDYAIFVENKTSKIYIVDNYLISDNYQKYSNDAIYALSAILENNALYVVYVSPNGSDLNGNGSIDNPFKSIKYALNQVINKGIVYVLEGNYFESNITVSKTLTLIGFGNVVVDLNNTSLFTITRAGNFKVYNITFINGNGTSGSVFNNNGNLNLNGVAILNSNATEYGGAIYNTNDLTINNCLFNNNGALYGGAVANNKNLVVKNSTFTNNGNVLLAEGGAIYNDDKAIAKIDNSVFKHNKVNGLPYAHHNPTDKYGFKKGSGAGIFNLGDLYVNNCLFDSNIASYTGGAIESNARKSNTVIIANSNFTNNLAYWGGAALKMDKGHLEIYNSTFVKNQEYINNGGAISISYCNGLITNSTFIKNSASYAGGAIHIRYSDMVLSFLNISYNNADKGGALSIFGDSVAGKPVNKVEIFNSTIAHNSGFDSAGGIFFEDIILNVKYSNIYDNFGGDIDSQTWINVANDPYISILDLNYNWWGSDDGPSDNVWIYASYFREWSKNQYVWSILKPSDDVGSNKPSSGNPTRPGTSQPVNSLQTGSSLNSNGNGNGFNTGLGTGTGSGFGSGSGNVEGEGSGTSQGGSSGSGEGFTGISGSNTGTIGIFGSASNSGAGGSSAGSSSDDGVNAYELSKKSANKEIEIPTYFGVFLIVIVLILLAVGYIHRKEGENE